MRNYESYSIFKDEDKDLSGNENVDVDNEADHGIFYLRNPYKSLVKKLIDNKEQFKLDLKLFPVQPKKLAVRGIKDYHHLLYVIPLVFSSLTVMKISNIQIQIESLQYLLDNLKCLNNLNLSDNYILQYYPNSNHISINWPISLKKLKVYKNYASFVEDKESPILLKLGFIQDLVVDIVQVTPKFLPNLISFDFELFIWQPDINDLKQFLLLNPQIIDLKIGGHIFYPELFDAIKCSKISNSLDLGFRNYNISESKLNDLPNLNMITRLTIHLDYESEKTDKIVDKFPNLTELIVEIYTDAFEELSTLTNTYPRIQELNINFYYKHYDRKDLNFPKLENLNSINFILDSKSCYNKINWDTGSCSNLKLVEFTTDQSSPFELPKLGPDSIDHWKVIYFPSKVSFYKIIK